MTFSEVATYVANRLRPDGDFIVEIPDTAPWYNTDFGGELIRLLKMYSQDTKGIIKFNETVTIAENDIELDLSDSANCAFDLFEVVNIWIDDVKMDRALEWDDLRNAFGPSPDNGRPYKWMQVRPSVIRFDRPVDGGTYVVKATGFATHPTITADTNQVIGIGYEDLDLFNAYVQVNIREFVASDEIGVGRLARVDEKKAMRLNSIRARQLRRAGYK